MYLSWWQIQSWVLWNQHYFCLAFCLLLMLGLASCASPPEPSSPPTTTPTPQGQGLGEKAKREQQLEIFKVRDKALKQLFKWKPAVRTEIRQAAGYGVFEVNGLNVVLDKTHGRGVIFEKATAKATYMQLVRIDLGRGKTLRPYQQVLVFHNPKQLHEFIASNSPFDISNELSITVYRLSRKGIKIQPDRGARYFPSPFLN